MSTTKTKYEPSILAIDNDLAFSRDEVWLYVELPLQPFEFLSVDDRVSHARKISQGLQGLVKSGSRSVECLMHITSVPFDDHTWMELLRDQTGKASPSPYWDQFSENMVNHVRRRGFREKQVFLSVMVGKRAEYRSNDASGPLETFRNAASKIFGVNDPVISDKEIDYWHRKAEESRRVLKFGTLNAQKVEANTIARLLQETLFPSMPMPEVSVSKKQRWGKGEIDGISTADITNHKKFLRIEQPDVSATGKNFGMSRVGYRATLSFSRFPETFEFPYQEPWMHFASMLSYPANLYSRFTLVPFQKVQKDVDKIQKTVEDQINNSGANGTILMYEQLKTAQDMKYDLEKSRTPWIYGRHRIVVSAPTEESLRDKVQETIDLYKHLDIDVTWSTGDQMRLLLENQPADKVRVTAYLQRQELDILAVGMPTGAGKVGDTVFVDPQTRERRGWRGPYVGMTTSRVQEPTFVSIHSAIAKNHPNGLVVTGSPGGGKSFFAFTLTYIMALQGVWCIYIDPKGDALPMANLPGLEGRVDTFDLKNGHDGLLEPFLLSDNPAEQQLMALETCLLFLGKTVNSSRESILMNVIRRVANQPSPGLNKVVQMLMDDDNPDAQAMGGSLELISRLPFARLCFSDGAEATAGVQRDVIRSDKGLTIVSLQSLDLPATSDNSTYSTSNRLAVGIMYLLATFTESLMGNADKSHPKAVIIDEAWAITSTPQGKNMIPRLARMGRALNTALVLVSQNARDFLDLTNNMSYRCAFRATEPGEVVDVLKFFQLEHEGPMAKHNMEIIRGLRNGECLMMDPEGKISRVQIDSWNNQMKIAFDTNPATRGKRAAEAAALAAVSR